MSRALTIGTSPSGTNLQARLAQIRDELQEVAEADLGDYLTFHIAEARTELQGAPQGGGRFPVEALMAGRVFGNFHIDVGIGDVLHGTPERLRGDDLLAFAGIAPAEALAIPKAQQFAEKIHAYTYPWTDRTNTRSRDLVDLLLLVERDPPSPSEVRESLIATFAARKTHEIPATLPPPPSEWASEFAGMAREVELSASDLAEGFEGLSRYWATHGFAAR